jgi:hypothetical protein
LARSFAGVANAANPIAAVRSILPGWASIPYLLVAVAGLLLQMILGLYSSGLSLLAVGLRVRRSRTVLVDAAIVVGFGSWIVLTPGAFLTDLQSLVELLACPVAAWAAVYLVDMLLESRAVLKGEVARSPRAARAPVPAFVAWLLGSALAVLSTSTPLVSGPLARGAFAQSSLGYFAGGAAAAVAYALAAGASVALRGERPAK